MELGLLLIIIGLIVAVLVHGLLGALLVIAGIALLIAGR